MRCRVVHIGGQPDHILDARFFDGLQQASHLQLAPLGHTIVAIGHGFPLLAVRHLQPDRHVRRDHFPHRCRALQTVQEPGDLRAPQELGGIALRGLQVVCIGTPVAAHVDHEQVKQRPLRQVAVDPLGLHIGGAANRRVLMKRFGRAGHQQRHILLGVARVLAQVFGVRVVVADLVVVPLPDLRHISRHAPHIGVHQVVAVAPTELVERLRHLAHLFGDQVVPHAAVGQLHLCTDGTVSVDRVPAMQEEVGIGLADLLIDLHATPGFIDAPPLAGRVTAPGKANVTRSGARLGIRGQAQMALHGR